MSRFRNHPPAFVMTSVRLVAETRKRLRPLFAGLAILHREGHAGAAWTIDVSEDGRLLPHAPQSPEDLESIVGLHRALGRQCRVGAALATPADMAAAPPRRPRRAAGPESACRGRPEIYGWSLMYQLAAVPRTTGSTTCRRFSSRRSN
ncbi:MAG: hypothetical protein ACK48M_10335 [Planctomycetia bacterium]|jgi:hypothetical protein